MTNKEAKRRTVRGIFWKFSERAGAQLVSFILSIILARLLTPDDYGTVALVTVFLTVMEVFVEGGFGTALIQKKDADDIDFSSIFYFDLLICLVLYVCMFFAAPYIASFYHRTGLTSLIRVISLKLIICGFKDIQLAYVGKHLMFRLFFFATLGGTIFSAIVGILMAYLGFGSWALVAQQLTNSTIDTVVLWLWAKWRPKRIFSWRRLRGLISFSWKILASNFLGTLYNNIRNLVIGRYYNAEDLAYYDRGQKFPIMLVTNIDSSIASVLLPVIACVQDDRECVKSMTRRTITISSYIMWPLMVGLAVCAEPVVSLILSDKWLPCVPYLRIFCLTYAVFPFSTANLNSIIAMGRSDLILKLEVMKKVVGIVTIILTVHFGALAIAVGELVSTPIGIFINAYPNKKLMNYTLKEQVRDMLASPIFATVMGICIYPLLKMPISNPIKLLMMVPVGALIYFMLSRLFKLEEYSYTKEIAFDILKKIGIIKEKGGNIYK